MQYASVGEMTKRITVKYNAAGDTKDANGDPVEDWQPLCTVWAKVEINSGREFYASRKVNAQWNGIFKFWYRPGIDSTMKVFYGDREFDILTVLNPNEANVQTWLECKEVV
jgi:SPP1 family predicted phage head-tail adaptor